MEAPTRFERHSSSECSGSSQSRASGSLKTVAASSNDTPCFLRLLRALRLEVARVKRYKRSRLKIPARNHRDLLGKVGKTGLVFARTCHRVPDSVFDQTDLAEAEFFVEEGKTELPAPEESKTTDLPDAEDREIPF